MSKVSLFRPGAVKLLIKGSVGNQNEMAKRLVRTNNFTKQTNVHDVDKHMCVLCWTLGEQKLTMGRQDGIYRSRISKKKRT